MIVAPSLAGRDAAPPGGVPAHRSRRLLVALSAACSVGLVAMTLLAAVGLTGAMDRAGLRWVHADPGSRTAALAAAVTRLGDGLPLVAAVSALGLVSALLIRRLRAPAALPLVALLVASPAATLLKRALSLPRPPRDEWLAAAGGYAFPSGHTTAGTAGFLTLALVTARLLTGRWVRGLVLAAGVLVVATIGWSRVALGVHWPSDVLGGWLLGTAVASALAAALPTRLEK